MIMSKLTTHIAAIGVACAMMLAGVSCGNSQDQKYQQLGNAATQLDSVLNANGVLAMVAVDSVNVAISADIALTDSVIHVDRIGNDLMEYFVAHVIKAAPADVVNNLVKSLEPESQLSVSLKDIYDANKTFVFTADDLRRLYKAKGLDFNTPAVKQQLFDLLADLLPMEAPYSDATVEVGISSGFLCYELTFPNDKMLAKSGQGLITRLYHQPLITRLASLGSLQATVIDVMNSLNIDGIAVTMLAKDSDKKIHQAFPWRTL